jgi:hypothetical protein
MTGRPANNIPCVATGGRFSSFKKAFVSSIVFFFVNFGILSRYSTASS